MLNLKNKKALLIFSICLNSLMMSGEGLTSPELGYSKKLIVKNGKKDKENKIENTEKADDPDEVIQDPESLSTDTIELEEVLYKSESENKFDETRLNRGNYRVNVGNGTIWTSTEVIKVNPEMNVELLTSPVVNGRKFQEGKLDFRVKLNYSDYITKYELKIYRGEDKNALDPVAVIKGTQLKNEDTISWKAGNSDYFIPGNQLTYKLKVYDKSGDFDETSFGIIDLVSTKSIENTDDFGKEYKDNVYSNAELRVQNIKSTFGKVIISGNNLTNIQTLKINGDTYTVDKETDAVRIERLIPSGESNLLVQALDKAGNTEEHNLKVEIDSRYFFGVGIADFTVGQYSNTDEYKDIDGNEMNGKLFKQGRIAFDGEAKFNDDLRGRLQFDTKDSDIADLFDDFFKRDKQDVFFRIREDNFYPTYGDDSIITNANSYLQQGKIFGQLEYKKSSILWGTYGTGLSGPEFSQLNRTLYGAKGELTSSKTTSFGEDKYSVVIFGSEAETIHAKNEFLGTGGSLYFLKNGEVIRDSEKISIEVRDKDSGVTEKVVYLVEGKDYEIDNYQGRTTLRKPLKDHVADSYSDLIQENGKSGSELYLIAEYDYEPATSESLSNMTYGGRGSAWLGEHLKIGGTYIKEEKDNSSDYEVYGGDITVRYSDGTYLRGEYSESESRNIDNYYISYNGGLKFTDKNKNPLEKNNGRAYSIRGAVNLYDLNKGLFKPYGNEVNGWYINVGDGFSGGQYNNDYTLEAYGGEIKLNPVDGFYFKTKYESMEKEYYLDNTIEKKESITGQAEYAVNEKLRLSAAVENKTEKTTGEEDKEAVIIAARVDYKITPNLDVYGVVQEAVKQKNYDNRSLYRLGLETRWNDRLTVKAEGKLGDNDTSGAEITADYKITNNYSIYLGYDLWNSISENSDKIVVGQRAKITDKFSVYAENQFLKEREEKSYLESYGADYNLTDNYRAGVSYQYGRVNPNDGDSYDRTAVSISSSYVKSDFQLQNKVEYRMDKGDSTDEVQYVLLNSASYRITESLRILAKGDYTISKDKRTHRIINEYAEAGIGAAYRPIYNNRFNLLGRYSYILNKENDSDRETSYLEESKHILEAEGNYKLTKRLTAGMKTAVKFENDYYKTSDGRNIKVEKNFALLGFRQEYEVIKDWDLMAEYRFLADIGENNNTENLKHGALVGVYKHIGENLKIGLGYNFSNFQDDLRDTDINAQGWFINIIGKF